MNQPPGLPPPSSTGGGVGVTSPSFHTNPMAPSPPPGLGGSGGNPQQQQQQGPGSVSTIVKAQIVFLLSTLTEEGFERNAGEIRTLCAQHGSDMYTHYLRRLIVVASPILQSLTSQSQSLSQPPPPPGLQGKQQTTGLAAFVYPGDRPLKQALQVPQSGAGVLAWRLLESEARRVCRDGSLAPYFASTLLIAIPPSTSPLLSLNIFSLPSTYLFSFASLLLSSPLVRNTQLPVPDQGRGLRERAAGILRGTYDDAIAALRSGSSWWNINGQDLNTQDGQLIIMAVYPLGTSVEGHGFTSSITSALPLDSPQREMLLQSLSVKFSSPAVVLQTLPFLAPGGTPTNRQIPLSDMLFELGDGLTSDEGVVKDVASRWLGPLLSARSRPKDDWEGDEDEKDVEEEVGKTLRGLVEGLKVGRRVDAAEVVKGIWAVTALDWSYIIKSFDQPRSVLQDALHIPDVLTLLFSTISLPVEGNTSAVSGLFSEEWKNPSALLRILEALLTSRYSIANVPALAGDRIVTPEDVQDVPAGFEVVSHPWNCQKVFDVLANESRQGNGDDARLANALLERGCEVAPELALIGLIRVNQPWSSVHTDLVERSLNRVAANQGPLSGVALSAVGRVKPERLVEILRKQYEASEFDVGRVVQSASDGGVLGFLMRTDGESLHMALDVAAIGSSKQLVNLEDWLEKGIHIGGETFIHATLDFLDHKIHAESNRGDGTPETAPLNASVYATFFRILRSSDLTPADIDHFKEIRNFCLQIYPRLMNLGSNANDEPGLSVVSFPDDIEAQVEQFFGRMYNGEISLDHVINILRDLKNSENERDNEVFACMLHTLFDEFKFVHEYPKRQLVTTGVLFGSIIQSRLIERTPLHVAVRYVLDALQNPPDSPMFDFGINALTSFQSRLPEFPHMCRALLQIPYLPETNPLLVSIIRTALTEAPKDEDADEQEPIVFTAIQVDDLDSDIEEPAEEVSDKILFIINNLSPNNFEIKMEEMRSRWDAKYARWFANYLVLTRVCVEPNNHELYARLLDALETSELEKHVLWETYNRALTLINAGRTMADATDRNILKHLGSWIGRLTVARDLPVKHRNLSIKDLLLQGYDAKRLNVALPFVCKIMEHCAASRVFHPPNPWLMAVLRFLAELYAFGDLKLNLKFEIEVLCKALDIALDTLEPTKILRSRTPPHAAAQPTAITGGYVAPPPQAPLSEQQASDAFLRRVDELVGQLPEYTVFNVAMFNTNPALKRIAHHAIDRAVREIITPVVERSVTIAGISSRDLLMKDFGMESDEGKLRQAAHLMVQKLAGSLALVTCKEPLRTSMTNNMKALMAQARFSEDAIPEVAIAAVVQDNLEVACSVIKNAAQEKAVKDIDVNLSPAYATRRKHREAGQLFWDPSAFTTTVAQSALPEVLRLTQHGLQPVQLRVYEDFGDQSRFVMASGIVEGDYAGQETMDPRAMGARNALPPPAQPPLGEVLESSILGTKLTTAQSMDKFQEMISDLDKLLVRLPVDSLAALPFSHDVKTIIRQIPVIATQSANSDQTALAFSQKVVQLLYKSQSALGREIYVTILQRLCDLFPKVAKEVTQWLIYAEDPRKNNVPVNVALIRANLIVAQEQDIQMAKMIIRDYSSATQDFAADLVRECILSDTPCVSRNQFAHTLEALLTAVNSRRATPVVERLLEDLQARSGMRSAPISERSVGIRGASPLISSAAAPPIDAELRKTLSLYFLEWVRLFTSPMPVETSFVPFVNRLQKQGILGGEEISSAFYRNSISLALEIYAQHASTGQASMFHGVDALSKLIALLLKNYSDTHGVSNDSAKTLYFAKIFTIAALSLVRDHEEMGQAFEQRPYYRFFSSLLSDLQCIQSSFPSAYYGCLRTFANHLGSIQPSIAPSFAYSWMSLISHRYFMPRLLQVANKEGWTDFYRVLMALFKFLNPFLQSAQLHPPSRIIFKGTLRILLVILKDFPEFLVEHYIGLCAAIPVHCIQLRNVVLCAFPRGVVLRQDVETLADLPAMPEFQQVPEVRTDYVRFLEEAQIKAPVDDFVQNVQNLSYLLPELRNRIAISVTTDDGTPGVAYNHTLLYSLTLYLGVVAVDRQIARNGQVTFDASMPEVTLLNHLVASLDAEGQYHFVNAIANQLRYPNAHTFFFMLYLLNLFSTCPPTSSIPERIARVLLERILAQRPHPFGLTLTMTTLLREPKFGFFEWPWARRENSPELWAIFQRVAGKVHA